MGVNRVDVGDQTVLDLTEDTVSPETLLEGATAHNSAGEQITGTVRASNPNLLDNWYFADPVNQRRKTEYTNNNSTYQICIDQWKFAIGKIKIKSDCISWGNPTSSGKCQLGQFLEGASKYTGKTITISIKSRTSVYSATVVVPFSGSISTNIPVDGVPGMIFVVFIDLNNDFIVFSIRADNYIFEIDIFAIKLEFGDHQTLAYKNESGNWILNDPPPNKSLELLKCQRYYQIFATESMRPTLAADFRPVMRANPALSTVEIDSKTYYTADASL